MHNKKFVIIILISLLSIRVFPQQDFLILYKSKKFSEILKKGSEIGYGSLDMSQKLLYLESQARTGKGHEAIPEILKILNKKPVQSKTQTTASIIYHSTGKIKKAKKYINQALTLDSNNVKALFTKALILTDQHKINQATDILSMLIQRYPDYIKTRLYFLIGKRICKASGNPARMVDFLKTHLKYLEKENRKDFIKAQIELYQRFINKPLFHIESTKDEVEIPLVNFKNSKYKCLIFKHKNKKYYILLDTGNSPGWTLHEPELKDILISQKGNEDSISTGSVKGKLRSYQIVTDKIDLGDFSVNNLTGSYFRKPRKRYFDGNINPYFIENRVVTMDFINNKFILRTRDKFEEYLKSNEEYHRSVIKVIGTAWPFVPVHLNGYASGLAMIETGAEDLSLKLEYAKSINLPLTPKTKMWQGKKYHHHETDQLFVNIGNHVMMRNNSEVWPVRFHDELTGLFDSVMIGPYALDGKYILSFDPFENRIILETKTH